MRPPEAGPHPPHPLRRVGVLAVPLSPDEERLVGEIAAGIDTRLRRIPRREDERRNVSFVIDCRKFVQEKNMPQAAKRRICAALERRYLDAGWRSASMYVMEHAYLRIRVALRG
jgi:hypothetical protein